MERELDMGKGLVLILGGARSGKSAHAEQLARQSGGRVLFVATAAAGDEEMAARIAAHQAARPSGWTTLEAPLGVGAAVEAAGLAVELVLVDCLTLLASNILLSLPEDASEQEADAAMQAELDDLLAAYADSPARWLVVSNEVGLGLVPPYPLGRLYRDLLGRANQRLAQVAGEVIFMVAGIPVKIK